MSSSAYQVEHSERLASATTTTINLITGGLGSGILSLPWAIAGASIVSAIVLGAFVLLLNAWTIMLLIRAGDAHQRFDLGSLLGMLPGQMGVYAKHVCNACIWLTLFLTLVGYFIVVEDALTYVVPSESTPEVFEHRWLWGVGAAVLLVPLCFLNMKYLVFTSTLSVLVNVYLFGYLVYQLEQLEWQPQSQACMFGLSSGTFTCFSVMMFSIIIQMCVLPMYEQLEDRSPAKFQKCVLAAFLFLFVFTMLFGACAYMIYGVETQSNVLKNFESHWAADVARIGMCLVVLGVYPIILAPMIAPVRVWEQDRAIGQSDFYRKIDDMRQPGYIDSLLSGTQTDEKPTCGLWSTVTTLVVLSCSMVLSFFISDLGFMSAINGAISVTMFVAFCPTMVGLYLVHSPTILRRVLLYGLFFFGIGMSAAGFIFTDNNAASLAANCVVPLSTPAESPL